MKGDDRRAFLLRMLRLSTVGAGAVAAGAWLNRRSIRPTDTPPEVVGRTRIPVAPDPALPDLVVARGEGPRSLVRAAIAGMGGIGRFVSRGDVVVVKPNVGWARSPEQAANTNPDVVAEVVLLCRSAGAGRVIVADVSCNDAIICFDRSGIMAAARGAGAQVVLPEPRRFTEINLGGSLGPWPVLQPFLECDKIINLPIAKHHSLMGVTLGLKNWYGILGGARNRLHQRIDECVVDLAAFMRPTLTLLDAYRVLVRNGPTGGSLADVEEKKTMIASLDPVALDAYAAKAWWDLDVDALPFLRRAEARGVGRTDFETLRTRVITS